VTKGAPRELPVDPERLRREFPDLDEADLEAYVTVTRRVLSDPGKRGQAMRELMELARGARAKQTGRTADETLALRYLAAVEKMQSGREGRPRQG
jgi:hypothetical protein